MKIVSLVAFSCVCTVAQAESLVYTPASTATSTNRFGRFIYSSENWKTAGGEYKYPATGDLLVYRGGAQLTAQGASGYAANRLSGFVYDGKVTAVSQGTFQLQSGGTGLVLTNTTATASWYLGVNLYGSEEANLYVHSGATWSFQRYFWQNDSGAATLVKRGAGKVQFYDSSRSSSNVRATWKKTRLEGGTFMWCIYGIDGNKYHPDAQMFPVGHDLLFSDRGSGVTFSIHDRDLELKDVTLREDSPLAAPNHVIASHTTTNVNVRIIGTPGLNPMGFGGKLTVRAGLLWNPTSGDNVFVFSNSVSTTQGDLIVSNGTVRLAQGASFSQLNKLALGPGAAFAVEPGAGAGFTATELVLADDEAAITVDLAVLSFTRAVRSGTALADGVYTASNCDWVKGNGYVLVNAALPAQDAWWTNDADHPKALAANVQTNWYGLHLSGEAFALTAGADSSVTLGAGGVDTAGAGALYTVSWPLLLAGSQVWQVGAGDTVALTTNALVLIGGTKWYVNNADSGVLRLDGAKTFPDNLVVSNGWLEARGDESLGAASGTTTFEIYNSSGRKGKLRILPEEGRSEVSFHRDITFHYRKCGDWGDFMTLPANCTVNFHGKMSTSAAGCEGNPWPCHWNYTCPATTVVHWWNTMHAQLNHRFTGGTHYVHKPLTGGDRFGVAAGAKVELLAANNSIGASTGSMEGRLICRVPYALDARSANRLLSLYGTLDLDGHDQAVSVLHKTYAGGVVTSAVPAVLHITRNQFANSDWNVTCTNHNTWVGAAGLSVERTAATYPFVVMARSTSTGTVQVTSGKLVMHAPNGQWPNASEAVVKGGVMALEHGAAFGTNTVVRFVQTGGTYGKLDLAAGVKQRVAALEFDGVAQRTGTWGSSSSAARHKDDARFTGTGVLRVGNNPDPTSFIVR